MSRLSMHQLAIAAVALTAVGPTLGHSQVTSPSMCYVPGSGTAYVIKAEKAPSTCRSGHGAIQLAAPSSAGPQLGPNGNSIPINGQGAYDLSNNDGLVATGSWGTGNIPATGAGTRLMWYPGKAAFRAGVVLGTQWDNANIGLGSIALGHNTTASGHYSFAASTNSIASGNGSFAMGDHSEATAHNAAAVGYRNKATGLASIAMGDHSEATAPAAIAMGNLAKATGYASVALGDEARATAGFSAALGHWAQAKEQYAVAIGNAIASGSGSIAIGGTASGNSAIAIGGTATASGSGSFVMGTHSVSNGLGSMAFGTRTDTNGKTGAIVIGDYSWNGWLKPLVDNHFVVRAKKFWLGTNDAVTATAGRLIETSTGAYLSTGGAWVSSSDSTKKHRWQDVDGEEVLSRLTAMPVRSWSYREEGDSVRHLGPTAQDFRNAFGLGDTDKAIASVDADGVSLAGIKALVQRTSDLRRDNAHLRQENEELRSVLGDVLRRLAELEAARR